MNDTPPLLEQLEKLQKEATPAPWKAATKDEIGKDWAVMFHAGQTDDNQHWHVATNRIHASQMLSGNAKSDCEIVALLRTELPQILQALRVQEAAQGIRWDDLIALLRIAQWLETAGAAEKVQAALQSNQEGE